jgi:hypothetical protein
MRKLCPLGCAIAMLACGEHPTGVSGKPDIPSVVPLVDIRTGHAPVGAVWINAVVGETVNVEVPGFFSLRTVWSGTPLTLWPVDDQVPEEMTRHLIYRQQDPGTLWRWPAGTSVLTVEPRDVFREGKPSEDLERALRVLSDEHPSLDFVVGSPGNITIGIDEDDPEFKNPQYFGLAYTWHSGGAISKIKIVYRSGDQVQTYAKNGHLLPVLLHEIGHGTGLGHLPPDVTGIMSGDAKTYYQQDFTPREQLMMHLQYSRRSGTRLAGHQEDETTAASASIQKVLVCKLE